MGGNEFACVRANGWQRVCMCACQWVATSLHVRGPMGGNEFAFMEQPKDVPKERQQQRTDKHPVFKTTKAGKSGVGMVWRRSQSTLVLHTHEATSQNARRYACAGKSTDTSALQKLFFAACILRGQANVFGGGPRRHVVFLALHLRTETETHTHTQKMKTEEEKSIIIT